MYRVAQGIFVFYSNAFGSEVFNDGSISLSSLLSEKTERERAKERKTFVSPLRHYLGSIQ